MSSEPTTDGVAMPKLDGTNYARWKLRIQNVLEAKDLDGIVYGDDQPPTEREIAASMAPITEENKNSVPLLKAKMKGFKIYDARARTVLTAGLDDKHMDIVSDCKTSREIWERLKQEYVEKSSTSLQMLLTEYFSYKKEPEKSISEYVAKIDGMAAKLRDLGNDQTEAAIMVRIITGLTDEYQDMIRIWNMTPVAFQNREILLKNLKTEEQKVLSAKPTGGALIAKSHYRKNDNHNSRNRRIQNWKQNGTCKWCKQTGHWWLECPTRPKDQKPGGEQNTRQTRDEPKRDMKHHNRAKALCAQLNEDDDQSWLFDTGASYHFTCHREWFTDYKPFENKVSIKFGDKLTLDALGKGTIRVISHVDDDDIPINLEDVWYIPNVSNNLFSWGAASRKGVSLVSNHENIAIKDDEGVIVTGQLTGANLWRLNLSVPIQANITRVSRTLDEWHEATGHCNIDQLKNMARKNCVTGMKITEEPHTQIRCGDCQLGKSKHASHPSSTRERSTEILGRVHCDLMGPIQPPSMGGSRFILLLKDEYSGYHFVYFLTTKSHVRETLKKFFNEVSIKTQMRVKILRTDNGSEFKNQGMSVLCDQEGILQEFSSAYTPQQNGESERANRTIIELARTMLQSSKLPLNLWAEAVNNAVYLKNRMTSTRNPEVTPFEILHGNSPDMSHLIRFGEELYIYDHDSRASKFSAKSIEAYMVGYGPRVNTYRCWIKGSNDITITSDAVPAKHNQKSTEERDLNRPFATFLIERQEATLSNEEQETLTSDYTDTRSNDEQLVTTHSQESTGARQNETEQRNATSNREVRFDMGATRFIPTASIDLPDISEETLRQRCNLIPSFDNTGFDGPSTPTRTSSVRAAVLPRTTTNSSLVDRLRNTVKRKDQQLQDARIIVHHPQTVAGTSGDGRNMPPAPSQSVVESGQRIDQAQTTAPTKRVLEPRNVRSTYARPRANVAQAEATYMKEPTLYEDAISGVDSKDWLSAIDAELNAHEKNQTWKVVKKTDNTSEITARWIFKLKYDVNGNIDRFKARLVARGFTQVHGQDYGETHAPVVRLDSIRLLFSLCALKDLKFKQFDVTTAFLNGDLEEELYLRPPEGLSLPEGHTLKLRKSLYGLKQAPRAWNYKFTQMLKLFNMSQTYSDPCVFVGNEPELVYLAVYVDDGLVFAKNENTIERLIGYLTKHFEVKLVNSNCFLGIEISHDLEKSQVFLHQTSYIKRVLKRFNMSEAKGAATPLPVGHELNQQITLNTPIMTDVPYAEAIGSLMYCAYATRPDITQVLSILSKYNSCPREAHWQAVKRVLRYLQATANYGLTYTKVDRPEILCYTDSDWAGDQENRRSTSGMVTFIAGGPISYKSQQQPVVALSSTEAEYIAASIATKELVWLKRFLEELQTSINTRGKLLCDNQSALKLMKNPEFHQRSKHIDIRFHFVREKFMDGLFEPVYVPTDLQKADIFTKALSIEKFERLRNLIGCSPAPVTLD